MSDPITNPALRPTLPMTDLERRTPARFHIDDFRHSDRYGTPIILTCFGFPYGVYVPCLFDQDTDDPRWDEVIEIAQKEKARLVERHKEFTG